MRKLLIIYIYIFTIMPACKSQSYQPNRKEAERLSNQAMDMIRLQGANKQSILSAIKILDLSIKQDSTYYLPYSNKAVLLCGLGMPQDALNTLNLILEKGSNQIELTTLKGFLLDKLGRKQEALEIYIEILNQYKERLKFKKSMDTELSMAYITLFIDSKAGKEMYRRLLKNYPDSPSIVKMKDIFENYDHSMFLKSYCDNRLYN